MRITAILIAAGLSSRMQGPNKLLQPIVPGKTLIQHTFAALQASTVDQLIVVTGRDADRVQSSIVNCDLPIPEFVFNANFALGMTTSIQAGLNEALDADAVMICLGDMPLLTSADYDALLTKFRENNRRDGIAAPFKEARKGNPVVFGAAHFQAIDEHTNMEGCASIIQANQSHLIHLDTTSDHYFFDIDTPENLAEFKTRAQ